MSLKLALTGSIGSGKSQALLLFSELGCSTISADQIVADLYQDPAFLQSLIDRFDLPFDLESFDKQRFAELVFADAQRRQELEDLIWPAVGARLENWLSDDDVGISKVKVAEIPLLFEAGMEKTCDATVVVFADDNVRQGRLVQRQQASLAEREARQLTQAEKIKRADYLLPNNGTVEELKEQIVELLQRLTQ